MRLEDKETLCIRWWRKVQFGDGLEGGSGTHTSAPEGMDSVCRRGCSHGNRTALPLPLLLSLLPLSSPRAAGLPDPRS